MCNELHDRFFNIPRANENAIAILNFRFAAKKLVASLILYVFMSDSICLVRTLDLEQ